MIPTPSDCYDLIRKELGDTEVLGGQVFTDSYLLPWFNLAIEPLLKRLGLVESTIVTTEFYTYLAQYQSTLNLSNLSYNLSQVERVWERGNVVRNSNVSSIVYSPTAQTVTVTFSGAHGLGTLPRMVETCGAVDSTGKPIEGLNGQWVATETSSMVVVLHGLVYPETYSSGLIVMTSQDPWSDELEKDNDSENFGAAIGQTLDLWRESKGFLRFPYVDNGRELKLTAKVGRTITASGNSLVVEDSLGYFVNKVAGLAAGSKGRADKKQQLELAAQIELDLLERGEVKKTQSIRYRFGNYYPSM